jgi:hypothetical protein
VKKMLFFPPSRLEKDISKEIFMTVVYTPQQVALQFEEALLTLHKLPPVRVPHCVTTMWLEMLRTPEEIQDQEPMPLRLRATPDQITRLDQVCDWIVWVEEENRWLVWQRARGIPWNIISKKLGCSRPTAFKRWKTIFEVLAKRLNTPVKTDI